MSEFYAKHVLPEDTFKFTCSSCGDCCRNVKESVMLESLDAYRLARHLKQSGVDISGVEEMFTEYAMPLTLGDTGYPIFVLKTREHLSSCIFLKKGKCSIYAARPRTCRLYPLSAKPSDLKGALDCYVLREKRHHFKDCEHKVSDWMNENFDMESRVFIEHDYSSTQTLAKLINRLREKGADEKRVLSLVLYYRYFNFNIDEPFLPQLFNNTNNLIKVLEEMIKGGGG